MIIEYIHTSFWLLIFTIHLICSAHRCCRGAAACTGCRCLSSSRPPPAPSLWRLWRPSSPPPPAARSWVSITWVDGGKQRENIWLVSSVYLSYSAITKWKKLDFLRLAGGCFSKCARPMPGALNITSVRFWARLDLLCERADHKVILSDRRPQMFKRLRVHIGLIDPRKAREGPVKDYFDFSLVCR